MAKLAIVTTHPVQYYAPLFEMLSHQISVKVFYTWGEQSISKYDPGFGQTIEWDIPLLNGYDYEFLENTSKSPGSHHFRGIINPSAITSITSFNPDAILVFGWSYRSHFNIIRQFKGKIPIWFRGDSTLLDESPGFRAFAKKLFLTWLYSYVDKVFYVGTNNKRYFEKYGVKKEKMVFAPHAIENRRFGEDRHNEASEIRKSLGINEDEILILFAGKFETKKNPLLLLEAFVELKIKHAHLLFVGSGPLDTDLKTRILQYCDKDADVTKRIHFMDFQNQKSMPAIYQSCNLFCLPSKGPGETWGLAVNEAMAAGRAIIISDKVGCGTDLVKTNFNGDIFSSDDKNDLVQKFKKLLKSETLNRYGENSASYIKNWSIEQTSASILAEMRVNRRHSNAT